MMASTALNMDVLRDAIANEVVIDPKTEIVITAARLGSITMTEGTELLNSFLAQGSVAYTEARMALQSATRLAVRRSLVVFMNQLIVSSKKNVHDELDDELRDQLAAVIRASGVRGREVPTLPDFKAALEGSGPLLVSSVLEFIESIRGPSFSET